MLWEGALQILIYMLKQLPVSHKGVIQQGHKSGHKVVVVLIDLVEKVIFPHLNWLRH